MHSSFYQSAMHLPPKFFSFSASWLIGIFLWYSWHSLPFLETSTVLSTEICDNAIDDDGDGLVDLNDPDCACEIIQPISLIPNPSFEVMNCCPVDRSELNCADTWIQASAPTTDFLHTCGWMGWEDFPPPLPFPDGQGAVGFRDGRAIHTTPEPNWKEYAGACLTSPLLALTTYRFEFYVGFVDDFKSPQIELTLFGSTECTNLPFGGSDIAFGCPANGPGWDILGAVRIGGRRWVKTSIEFTPEEDIHAIVIGPSCAEVQNNVSTYYFLDNLVLSDIRSFDFHIKEINHRCASDFSIQVPNYPEFTYQWYADGVALIGENKADLKHLIPGLDYQVRITNSENCKLSAIYHYELPVITQAVEAIFCAGNSYHFGAADIMESGFYVDTFQTIDNCDSIVYLQLSEIDIITDTIQASIFEGEHFEIGNRVYRMAGEHRVPLNSVHGCDSIIYLQLDYFSVFIPNAFTPNGDGINDTFIIFGGAELKEIRNLKIFNRWGALVYHQQGLLPDSHNGWDGTFRGRQAAEGVYLYEALVVMNDDIMRPFYGSLTLVR